MLQVRGARIAAALVACAVLGLVACGDDDSGDSGGSGDGGKRSIAFFAYGLDDPWGVAQVEGAEAAAKKAGASIKVFDGAGDAASQLTQIQDAVAAGTYDGLIISPIDGQGVVPAVEDASADDIKVVCAGSPCGPDGNDPNPQVDGQLAYIGVTGKEDGEIQGDLVAKFCEGKDPCEVGYIPGFAEFNIDAARLESFKQKLGEHPNIKLVAVSEGQYDKAKGRQVAQDMLQAHPDLAVIAGADDMMIVGAEQAAREAGRELAFVGNAGSTEGVERVQNGTWLGDTVWLPKTEGRLSVETLMDALAGKEVKSSIDVRELSPIGPAITPDNADSFEAEWGHG